MSRMSIVHLSRTIILALAVSLCHGANADLMTPPEAKRVPHPLEIHGDVRIDDYYWLRERDDPEVIAYLEAENEYTGKVMAHTESFQEALFDEIKGRIKQDDSSVPYKLKDFYYYSRFEEGRQYPIHCRKYQALDAPESILLDLNEYAAGHDFYAVSGRAISHNQDLLAFAEDTGGRRIYTIRFKDLSSGELLDDEIPEVTGNMTWADDNKTLFYSKQDPVTLRSYRIYRHALGTRAEADVLVYEEPDETFRCYVGKSRWTSAR